MSKLVIVTKSLENGAKRVFETLRDASEALGVSETSLSMASVDSRDTKGYLVRRVERVYLLHMRAHLDWMLAVRNSHNKFVEYGNPKRRIGDGEYDEVRDITVGFYWPE